MKSEREGINPLVPPVATAAWSVWLREAGGSTCGAAPSAGTSDAATLSPANTPQSTFMRPNIRFWQASNREKRGFSTIGRTK